MCTVPHFTIPFLLALYDYCHNFHSKFLMISFLINFTYQQRDPWPYFLGCEYQTLAKPMLTIWRFKRKEIPFNKFYLSKSRKFTTVFFDRPKSDMNDFALCFRPIFRMIEIHYAYRNLVLRSRDKLTTVFCNVCDIWL